MEQGIVGNYFMINAVLVNDVNDVEIFQISVTPQKYLIVRKRLEAESKRIVNMLKRLQDMDLIKSIKIPKNKKMQNELKKLLKAKKIIKHSLKQLKDFYT